MEARGTVAQVSSRDAKTKFGMKKTYSFKLDNGNWYSTGFKAHGLLVGDVVRFNFLTDSYGNQVDPSGIAKTGAVPLPPNGSSTPTIKNYPIQSFGGKGVFPIPALDGQRSIVRQNALTNAREAVMALIAHDSKGGAVSTSAIKDAELANRIVDMSRIFEAYSCGDSDVAEVMEEMKEMEAAYAKVPA